MRVKRAEREREMKRVVGSMARVCWLGGEGGVGGYLWNIRLVAAQHVK